MLTSEFVGGTSFYNSCLMGKCGESHPFVFPRALLCTMVGFPVAISILPFASCVSLCSRGCLCLCVHTSVARAKLSSSLSLSLPQNDLMNSVSIRIRRIRYWMSSCSLPPFLFKANLSFRVQSLQGPEIRLVLGCEKFLPALA